MTYTEKRLEEFKELLFEYGFNRFDENGMQNDEDLTKLHNFLSTKITQALAEERERVRGILKKYKDAYHYDKDFLREITRIEPDILSSLDNPLTDK